MTFLQNGFAAIISALLLCYLPAPAGADNDHSKAIVDYYAAVEAFEECQRGKATDRCGDPPVPPPVTDEGMPPIDPMPEPSASPCSPPFSWIADGLGVDCWPPHAASYDPPCGGPSTDYVQGVTYCARDNQDRDRDAGRATDRDDDNGCVGDCGGGDTGGPADPTSAPPGGPNGHGPGGPTTPSAPMGMRPGD